MKKMYIIPGWQESSKYKIYQSLSEMARNKGYDPIFINIDWSKKLSEQLFKPKESDVIFGFSLGAILAHLVAQNYECNKLILASMTPFYSFKKKDIKNELVNMLGKDFINDIAKNLSSEHKAKRKIVIYGDKENEEGDIIMKKTAHRLNARYNETIIGLL